MVPVAEFEAARPHLTGLAFRLLGSVHDAEDAVQSTWIKASTADTDGLRSPAAWLTTVLTRVCLDQLRMRNRRREEPLLADAIPAETLAADEQYLRRENVSRALMVVLELLTPSQRVAYVLHDLFDIPFDEVAKTLDTTPGNAKKHASRARIRIEQTEPAPATTGIDSAVVDAFLTAAAGGDIGRMLALMTEDCVRTADPLSSLPVHQPSSPAPPQSPRRQGCLPTESAPAQRCSSTVGRPTSLRPAATYSQSSTSPPETGESPGSTSAGLRPRDVRWPADGHALYCCCGRALVSFRWLQRTSR